MDYDLILASGSPRRRDILANMGFKFKIEAADIDETAFLGEDPADYTARMARQKALKVAASHPELPVLGADTAVILDGQIFGKPRDRADAKNMILALSGRTHQVLTAVTVVQGEREESILERTEVTFCQVSPELAEIYVASGESDDKSGSYALQGIAAMLIEKVHGSVSCVVGLPACQVRLLLGRFGLQPRTVSAS